MRTPAQIADDTIRELRAEVAAKNKRIAQLTALGNAMLERCDFETDWDGRGKPEPHEAWRRAIVVGDS